MTGKIFWFCGVDPDVICGCLDVRFFGKVADLNYLKSAYHKSSKGPISFSIGLG